MSPTHRKFTAHLSGASWGTIHDLDARYFLPIRDSQVELYAGVNNVLDETPPFGILGVEVDEAIYDALGRRYFVGFRSTF